jgi:hypothetical protein
MLSKRFINLLLISIFLSLMTSCSFNIQAKRVRKILRNGEVCNYSSHPVWLTLTESGRQQAYSLSPGNCTDISTQDAEAIWGKICNADPCSYQAWKVGAGHFGIFDDESSAGFLLRIKGWGMGSGWHISRRWPRPELFTIDYSLER